jgi:hypothetical protein
MQATSDRLSGASGKGGRRFSLITKSFLLFAGRFVSRHLLRACPPDAATRRGRNRRVRRTFSRKGESSSPMTRTGATPSETLPRPSGATPSCSTITSGVFGSLFVRNRRTSPGQKCPADFGHDPGEVIADYRGAALDPAWRILNRFVHLDGPLAEFQTLSQCLSSLDLCGDVPGHPLQVSFQQLQPLIAWQSLNWRKPG